MSWRPALLIAATVVAHLAAASAPCPASPGELRAFHPGAARSVHAHRAPVPVAAHDHASMHGAAPAEHAHGAPMEPADSEGPVVAAPCPCGCDRDASPATGAGRLGPAIPTAVARPRWEGRPPSELPRTAPASQRAIDPPEPVPIAL